MIQYVQGDVIQALKDGWIEVLSHGVNGMGRFQSGIAGQIAKEFPHVREEYLKHFSYVQFDLGHIQAVRVDMPNRVGHIVNCGTQEYDGACPLPESGRYVDYAAFAKAMDSLKDRFRHHTIGMPKIGAGLAKGDWYILEAILQDTFKDKIVYVYELEKKS